MKRKSMRVKRAAFCLVLGALALSSFGLQASPGDNEHVKFTATAGKIDKDGQQTITIVTEVGKGWHVYANPVKNEQLNDAKTVVTIAAPKKLDKVDISYPAGTKLTDKDFGEYMVYEGKVEIIATLKRTAGDVAPVDVTVKFLVCNDKTCIPGTAKLQAK